MISNIIWVFAYLVVGTIILLTLDILEEGDLAKVMTEDKVLGLILLLSYPLVVIAYIYFELKEKTT